MNCSHSGIDPVRFAEHKLNFHPDPIQSKMLRIPAHRLIINCTRQWGKSTVTAIKAIHRALYMPESLILFVSPSGRQSGEFLQKLKTFMRRLNIKPKTDGNNEI